MKAHNYYLLGRADADTRRLEDLDLVITQLKSLIQIGTEKQEYYSVMIARYTLKALGVEDV